MIIEKVNNGQYSQCRIPGIVITERGTLLAYYECRKTNSDWADIDIRIIRSTDGGETWETAECIRGNGNTLNNPVMFVRGEELHFLFLKNYKLLHHCVSLDDGRTFSEPREKALEPGFFYNAAAVGPGHGIVHRGKMIVPMWLAYNRESPKEHRPSVLTTLYSADGEKWSLGELIGESLLTNPSEAALAVTSEGRVLISIRNENDCHRRAFALSDSGYESWSRPVFNSQMPDPICMGSMGHENGKIYHMNCNSESHREDLTLKISEDCFNSFESVFVDTPAGYSDFAVKDGTLYILYERDCTNGGLHFKKLKL